MDRDAIHKMISEEIEDEELREVLRSLIGFIDSEDEDLVRRIKTGDISIPYAESSYAHALETRIDELESRIEKLEQELEEL